MDYSGFTDFPFPGRVAQDDIGAKEYFMQLSDDAQLALLSDCHKYDEFVQRVKDEMKKE